MPDAAEYFPQLLSAAKAGDDDAMSRLIEDYQAELLIVARRKLGASLRPYFDSFDLLQSVNRSFIVGVRQNRFEVTSHEKLMGLVSTILRRKVAKHWRKMQRQQRDSRGGNSPRELADYILARRQTDADPAVLTAQADELEFALSQLDDVEVELVRLRLEGYNTTDAAEKLGLDAGVLRVRLSRMRKRLKDSHRLSELL